MTSEKLTRKRFVVAGAASVAAAGVAGAGVQAARAPTSSLIVGRFVRPEGRRAAVVSIDGGEALSVTLDSGAFVAHGADGIVDSLSAFAPGEQVVVRGDWSSGDVAAVEFQSLYTKDSGVYERDDAGDRLVTPSGKRIRIPQDVIQRDAPDGIAPGRTRAATIWVRPATGEATAVNLRMA